MFSKDLFLKHRMWILDRNHALQLHITFLSKCHLNITKRSNKIIRKIVGISIVMLLCEWVRFSASATCGSRQPAACRVRSPRGRPSPPGPARPIRLWADTNFNGDPARTRAQPALHPDSMKYVTPLHQTSRGCVYETRVLATHTIISTLRLVHGETADWLLLLMLTSCYTTLIQQARCLDV